MNLITNVRTALASKLSRKHAVLGLGLGLGTVAAIAATGTNADFDAVNTKLKAWMEGSLGKTFALGSLATGLGIGIVKQSVMSVVTGVGIALAASVGPGVLQGIFTAAL